MDMELIKIEMTDEAVEIDVPIYGQRMRLLDCQSTLGNDIGYPFDATAFAELCENIQFLERHRAVLAPSIDEAWRTDAIVNVAAVGIRRLDLERVSEPGWWYIVGDEPSEKAARAAHREMMWVVDALKLKDLRVYAVGTTKERLGHPFDSPRPRILETTRF